MLLLEDGSMNRVEVPRLLDLDPGVDPLSYKKEAEVAEKTARKIQHLIEDSSSNVVSTVARGVRTRWLGAYRTWIAYTHS